MSPVFYVSFLEKVRVVAYETIRLSIESHSQKSLFIMINVFHLIFIMIN